MFSLDSCYWLLSTFIFKSIEVLVEVHGRGVDGSSPGQIKKYCPNKNTCLVHKYLDNGHQI